MSTAENINNMDALSELALAFVQPFNSLFCLLSLLLRSLLQPVILSWEGRTLMRCWSGISVRNLPRSTRLMSKQSPGLWSGSTRSVKNWKGWWVPTPLTYHSTLSVSWMTLMSVQKWTGMPKNHFLIYDCYLHCCLWSLRIKSLFSFSLKGSVWRDVCWPFDQSRCSTSKSAGKHQWVLISYMVNLVYYEYYFYPRF